MPGRRDVMAGVAAATLAGPVAAAAAIGARADAGPWLRIVPAGPDREGARALADRLAAAAGRPVAVGAGTGGTVAVFGGLGAGAVDFPGALLFRGSPFGMAPAELAAWCATPAARDAWAAGFTAAGLRAFPCGLAVDRGGDPAGPLPFAGGRVVELALGAAAFAALAPALRDALVRACTDGFAADAARPVPAPPAPLLAGLAVAGAGEAAAAALGRARRAAGPAGAAAFAAWAAARRGEAPARGHSTSR